MKNSNLSLWGEHKDLNPNQVGWNHTCYRYTMLPYTDIFNGSVLVRFEPYKGLPTVFFPESTFRADALQINRKEVLWYPMMVPPHRPPVCRTDVLLLN